LLRQIFFIESFLNRFSDEFSAIFSVILVELTQLYNSLLWIQYQADSYKHSLIEVVVVGVG
jgi:hypothetical protein